MRSLPPFTTVSSQSGATAPGRSAPTRSTRSSTPSASHPRRASGRPRSLARRAARRRIHRARGRPLARARRTPAALDDRRLRRHKRRPTGRRAPDHTTLLVAVLRRLAAGGATPASFGESRLNGFTRPPAYACPTVTRPRERPLHAVQVARYVVAYVALGVVTLLFWWRRRDRPTRWAAIAFGSLGFLELLSLIPNDAACPSAQSTASSSRCSSSSRTSCSGSRMRSTANRRRQRPRTPEPILVVWTFALPQFRSRGRRAALSSRRSSRSSSSTGRCFRSFPPGASGVPVASNHGHTQRRMQLLAIATKCSR